MMNTQRIRLLQPLNSGSPMLSLFAYFAPWQVYLYEFIANYKIILSVVINVISSYVSMM